MTRSEEVIDALRSEFTCTCGKVHELPPVTVPMTAHGVRTCPCGQRWGFLEPGHEWVSPHLVVHDEASGWSSW